MLLLELKERLKWEVKLMGLAESSELEEKKVFCEECDGVERYGDDNVLFAMNAGMILK